MIFVASSAWAQDIRITEFQAINITGATDENGTRQPWIEIWNPSPTTKVSLADWTLSNGTRTFTFPAVEIMPDDRMIIWASGKNRTGATAPLHTPLNFTLPTGGGTLTLTRPFGAGNASRFLSYPAQVADTSYGRDETDAATDAVLKGKYTTPTPGARNNYTGSGVAGKVLIGVASKAFTGVLPVTLSQASPATGAVIRYTLDGTMPTATSSLYSTALNISATQVVRARVFKTGLLPGETETEGYLLLDSTTTTFSSTMPLIVLTNFGLGQPPDATDQAAFMWVWEPAAPDNRSRFTNAPTLATRIVMDRRGSSTLGNAKYNVNVEARKGRDEDDSDVKLLGFAGGSDYVFSGPFTWDRSEIHNPFIYALSNQIGRYAPGVRNVEVFFDVTGGSLNAPGGNTNDYFGIYNIVQKIRRDKTRVDVTKLDPTDNDAVGKTGGYIWKVDRLDSGDTGFSAGGQTMAYYYPKEIDITSPQRAPQAAYLTSYITSFNNALQSGTWNNPTTGYAAWLDVGEAIDHHLLNVWPMNVDGMRLSGYWHKERGGKLVPGPIWDFDRTMESADARDDEPRSWRAPVSDFGTDFFNYTWWNRLFLDIDFYQKYIDRWQALRRGAFSQANVNALLDSWNATMSAECIDRDVARWGKTKRTGTFPGSPTANYDGTQAGEILRIKDWLQVRATFMDSQWVGPVTASVAEGHVNTGTQVTLSGPAGATIYYTLNGADPRPSGGGAPSGVLTYTGTPITINATTRIRTRAYNANWLGNAAVLIGANNPPLRSAWGGFTNVRYATDALAASGNLVVTEVNYHPANPTTAELAVNPLFADSDFEFIELKNVGAVPIDLGGAQFTAGVTFTFSGGNAVSVPAGGFIVVAANPTAFAVRYPAVTPVVGPWSGDLDNGGEQIVLKDAGGAPIAAFTYDDTWAEATDGGGYTLAIYDPLAGNAALSTIANWCQSAALKGSPGASEPNRAPTVSFASSATGNVTGIALSATVTDDRLPGFPGTPPTLAWTISGGPGTANFAPPDAAVTTATFSLPGIYLARLTANDASLAGFGEVSVYAKDTPAAWLARNPGIGTLDDDFDLDGWSNFAEFSFGLDPNVSDVNARPVTTLESGHLTLTYSRIKPPASVLYEIEVADNPGAFRSPNPGEMTEQILTDNAIVQTVKVTDTVSTPGPPARFLRLKVSPAP